MKNVSFVIIDIYAKILLPENKPEHVFLKNVYSKNVNKKITGILLLENSIFSKKVHHKIL